MKRKVGVSLLLGSILLIAWSCNEDLYIDPIRYSSIRGKVFFGTTRKPARNVLVRLSPTSRSVDTDSTGAFRFDSVAVGKYTLQTSLTGYLNEFSAIEITDQQITNISLFLGDDKTQNRPPTSPTVVKPTAGNDSVPIAPMLRWKSTDPDRDTLTFDITLYQSGILTPIVSVSGQKADSLLVKNLAYNTVYSWQVTAKDGVNTVQSAVFSFRTQPFPDFAYVYVKRVNGQLQLFSSDASTLLAIPLTTQGNNWRPLVSPNRREIAFISNTTTDLHLYLINRDGQNRRQVTTLPLAGIVPTNLSYCWSPDGTQLVYPVNDKLYVVRTDGTGLSLLTKLAPGQFFSGCDWTSQGNQIVARVTSSDPYDNQLVLIDPKTGVSKPLYTATGQISNPVFSVDGKQVMFSLDISPFKNEQGRQLNARVQVLNLATGLLTDVSGGTKPAGTNDLDPRFSPNGARIIFTNIDNTGLGSSTIATMNLSGLDRKQILNAAEMPYWW